jgi:hypothetical protein
MDENASAALLSEAQSMARIMKWIDEQRATACVCN